MEDNLANEEQKNGQNPPQDAPQKRKVGKAWYWMGAALVLIVALIVVLAVVNANHKKNEEKRLTLAEAVAEVNSKTPALGATMKLDSVKYDAQNKLVTYYNSILEGPESNQQLMRDYYHRLSAEDLKVLARLDFMYDYLAQYIVEEKASLGYVYSDTDGKTMKEILLTNEELTTPVDEVEKKRASLVMIAQEALSTQASCPQKIDENTTITDCQYEPVENQLVFTFTLAQGIGEIDKAEFEKQAAERKEGVTHALAHDPKYNCSDVTVIYRYLDKNGMEVYQLVISPNDYKEHMHEHEHEHSHEHGHSHEHEHGHSHEHEHQHAHE